MITEKEINNNTDLKAMFDKISNYSPDIANGIAAFGVEKDVLEYLATHEVAFDNVLLKFIRTGAKKNWYELWYECSDNMSVMREIALAYDENIEPEYVKEYINTSNDEMELEEKRSQFKEWKEKQKQIANDKNNTDNKNNVEDVKTTAEKTKAAQEEKITDGENEDENLEAQSSEGNATSEEVELLDEKESKPYISVFIEDLLGVSHSYDNDKENNISDDALFQNLIKLTTEAININKDRNTTILYLRKALNGYKTYSANVEKQINQLKHRNEQLENMYNNAIQQLEDCKAKNEAITRKLNEVFKLQIMDNNLLEG